MLNNPKDLIVQGKKATRPNSFLLDFFLFTASFIILFISSYLSAFFLHNPFYPSQQLEIIFPQTCHFLSLRYFFLSSGQIRVLYCRIMFKEGIGLLICWLVIRLAIGSNREVVYMLMHFIR